LADAQDHFRQRASIAGNSATKPGPGTELSSAKELRMPSHTREASFAAFATDQRPRLQGAAYLLHGDVQIAESIVDVILAQLYDFWPLVGNAEDAVFRRLLDARPGELELPWQRRARIELIDRASGAAGGSGIAAELATLEPDQRRALVLDRFAKLPMLRIADIMDLAVTDAQRLARSAQEQLIQTDPARRDDQVLAAELANAIPYDLRSALPAAMDVAHGKQLVRRRVGRRLAVTAAAVAVLTGIALWAPRTPLGADAPVPAPAPSAVRPTAQEPPCRNSDEPCRIRVLEEWRSEMADIVRSYVDPNRTYFTGFGYESESIYESGTFWQGRGGVLGLYLSPSQGSATAIYLQVATSRDRAIRCGLLTHQECVSQRFLSGNRDALTETTYPTEGVEVQYSADGTEVVTLVARDVTNGRTLDIGRGDLIELVQDPRLRLPHG
jgi:hypothetical protein